MVGLFDRRNVIPRMFSICGEGNLSREIRASSTCDPSAFGTAMLISFIYFVFHYISCIIVTEDWSIKLK